MRITDDEASSRWWSSLLLRPLYQVDHFKGERKECPLSVLAVPRLVGKTLCGTQVLDAESMQSLLPCRPCPVQEHLPRAGFHYVKIPSSTTNAPDASPSARTSCVYPTTTPYPFGVHFRSAANASLTFCAPSPSHRQGRVDNPIETNASCSTSSQSTFC